MFAQAKLADTTNRVKPDESRQRETNVAELPSRNLGHRVGRNTSPMTSTTPTARCGPACRVVWQGSGLMAAPYADGQLAGVCGNIVYISMMVLVVTDNG
jgi:hypothetical protein